MFSSQVRIGQKNRRGVAGEKSVRVADFKNIDVTTASRNVLGPRNISAITLSPMRLGPIVDKQGNVAKLFENYWQFSKMWPTAGHCLSTEAGVCRPSPEWYKFRQRGFAMEKGKRRPLPKARYGFPQFSYYNEQPFGYVESRKKIYVPLYYYLIKDLPAIAAMKQMLRDGQKIMIIDNDGPSRTEFPNGMLMTEQNWKKMIDDPSLPFGHGYVVAGILAGLPEHVMLDLTKEEKDWAQNAVKDSFAEAEKVQESLRISARVKPKMKPKVDSRKVKNPKPRKRKQQEQEEQEEEEDDAWDSASFSRMLDSFIPASYIAECEREEKAKSNKSSKSTVISVRIPKKMVELGRKEKDPIVPTICYIRKSQLSSSARLDV